MSTDFQTYFNQVNTKLDQILDYLNSTADTDYDCSDSDEDEIPEKKIQKTGDPVLQEEEIFPKTNFPTWKVSKKVELPATQ